MTSSALGTISARSVSRLWRIFFLAFALLCVPMALWALASPLGSVPDEPSHGIRAAAVARGQFASLPWAENPTLARADVPRYVAELHERTCYIMHPQVTPACEHLSTASANEIVTTGTSAGGNGILYYAIVGLPTLVLSGDPALFGMRIINVLLCAAALAAMIAQLACLPRFRWAIVGVVVALTPMVMFLSGSINPNAIEAASASTILVTLIVILTVKTSPRALWGRVLLVAVAVTLLVNTRSIALLWLLIIVVVSLVMAKKEVVLQLVRQPAAWTLVALAGAISLIAAIGYAQPALTSASTVPGDPTNSATAFVSMLVRTFEFAPGYVGDFGWLDTPSPGFSVIVWSALIVGLVVVAFIWGSGKARWLVVIFSVAMLAIPPIVQAILAPSLGYIWQGRYMLAMLICLLVSCGLALDNSFSSRPSSIQARRAAALGLTLVAIAHCASFVWVFRRYVVGSHGSLVNMFTHPTWQPPVGWIPLSLLLVFWAVVASAFLYRWLFSATTTHRVVQ